VDIQLLQINAGRGDEAEAHIAGRPTALQVLRRHDWLADLTHTIPRAQPNCSNPASQLGPTWPRQCRQGPSPAFFAAAPWGPATPSRGGNCAAANPF
jgi:hypothetical protein